MSTPWLFTQNSTPRSACPHEQITLANDETPALCCRSCGNLPIYASESDAAPTAPHDVIDNDFGEEGGTKAHYLPIEPRRPAPTGETLPLNPSPPPSILSTADDCSFRGADKRPCSIAESFQDMLRAAFQAGATATTTGESFETWYHREVLQ